MILCFPSDPRNTFITFALKTNIKLWNFWPLCLIDFVTATKFLIASQVWFTYILCSSVLIFKKPYLFLVFLASLRNALIRYINQRIPSLIVQSWWWHHDCTIKHERANCGWENNKMLSNYEPLPLIRLKKAFAYPSPGQNQFCLK